MPYRLAILQGNFNKCIKKDFLISVFFYLYILIKSLIVKKNKNKKKTKNFQIIIFLILLLFYIDLLLSFNKKNNRGPFLGPSQKKYFIKTNN